MDNTIKHLIRLNIELEGALRVADSRPCADALDLAREKFAEMTSLFAALSSSSADCVVKVEKPAPVSEPVEKTVSEKTAETARGDIRKMLTLNDKFLFRREIFNGSDAELNDTLDLVASMDTLREAEEYLYEDLQLDAENDSVRQFISILESYFGHTVR